MSLDNLLLIVTYPIFESKDQLPDSPLIFSGYLPGSPNAELEKKLPKI